MNVNLGKGFGPLDFDENGKMYSIFPEDLPYVDDVEGLQGEDGDMCVYVDAELVEAVCNAGLDFEEFLRADVEGRKEMLDAAGIDASSFDLDFDHDIRERLESEGLLDEYYGDEDDEDFEDEEDEYGYEEDDEDDEDGYDDEEEAFEDPEEFEEGDEFEDFDDDYGDENFHDPEDKGDEFFGDL